MHPLNVLIVGDGNTVSTFLSSKFLNKLYITSQKDFEGAISINFNTFRELAQKCKALQIDIVIVENEKWILQGIADVLKKNFINVFALSSYWSKILSYNSFTKNLLKKYGIDVPKLLLYPSAFPVVIRAEGLRHIAYSMDELIGLRQSIDAYPQTISDSTFLEEFIEGEEIELLSLFDGKTLLSFIPPDIDKEQQAMLKEYAKKLQQMLLLENADFMGFLLSKLILSQNNLYSQGFGIGFPKPDIDFIYLLNAAIYQKLYEISL